MKLYLLELIYTGRKYDEYLGFVVRAKDETQARQLASDAASGEKTRNAYLDPLGATCTEIDMNGEPDVILSSYNGVL